MFWVGWGIFLFCVVAAIVILWNVGTIKPPK